MRAPYDGRRWVLGSVKGAHDVGGMVGTLCPSVERWTKYRVPASIDHSGYKGRDAVRVGARYDPTTYVRLFYLNIAKL